jgi:hypothetical protein
MKRARKQARWGLVPAVVTFRVHDDIVRDLHTRAKAEGLSNSAFVRELVMYELVRPRAHMQARIEELETFINTFLPDGVGGAFTYAKQLSDDSKEAVMVRLVRDFEAVRAERDVALHDLTVQRLEPSRFEEALRVERARNHETEQALVEMSKNFVSVSEALGQARKELADALASEEAAGAGWADAVELNKKAMAELLTQGVTNEEYVKATRRAERAEAAIRAHRDARGDDRCWLDDEELYRALPEGYTPPARDTTVELARCEQFIAQRQNPATVYVSPQREIERLQALFTTVLDVLDKHCRGFIDKPTTIENLPELVDRICASSLRETLARQAAREALEVIARAKDCGCTHDTADCCAVVGEFCPRCIAAVALRGEGNPPETRRRLVLDKFDVFLHDVGLDVCDFFNELSAAWKSEAAHTEHPTVKSCLESAADQVAQAGMDWYVSTK